jgi:hypothetical protein
MTETLKRKRSTATQSRAITPRYVHLLLCLLESLCAEECSQATSHHEHGDDSFRSRLVDRFTGLDWVKQPEEDLSSKVDGISKETASAVWAEKEPCTNEHVLLLFLSACRRASPEQTSAFLGLQKVQKEVREFICSPPRPIQGTC